MLCTVKVLLQHDKIENEKMMKTKTKLKLKNISKTATKTKTKK